MKMKKFLLYGLHILKNHVLTTIIFVAFMYVYFSIFRNTISQFISGIIISLLYLYGNFASARFYAKKRDALNIQCALVSILIASLPTIILAYLAVTNLAFMKNWEIKPSWPNTVYRIWNSPFIGVFSYAEVLTKKLHSLKPLINSYILTASFLPISSIVGYIIGVLEKKGIIKLPEMSLSKSANKRQNKKPNKTGKAY